jgi:hypothetical protein
VFVEFVKAMKEQQNQRNSTKEQEKSLLGGVKRVTIGEEDEDSDENEEEDAVLEEMLNAETGGYGDFDDDFDDMEDEVHREEGEKIDREDIDEELQVEEEEEFNLFGKREQAVSPDDDLPAKKAKKTIS